VKDSPETKSWLVFNHLRNQSWGIFYLICMHGARGVWKSHKKWKSWVEFGGQTRKLTKFLISHFAVRLLHAKRGQERNSEVGSCQDTHTHICSIYIYIYPCGEDTFDGVCRPSRGAIKNSKLSLTFGFGQKITYSINITQASNARTQLATLVILSAKS